jgi:uridine kinase
MVIVQPAVTAIAAARAAAPASRAVLVAISGIDGSGKGHVSERLAAALNGRGLRTVVLPVDGWLRLPDARFSASDPGGHFYTHAIRFDELFGDLVLPLRDRRSVRVTMDYVEETALHARRHTYEFQDVDVILLEGIFLLKQELRAHYDLAIWIDCSFNTALARAIARAQEGLGPDDTIRAYHAIYFPAQEQHLRLDKPRDAAMMIIRNDQSTEPAGVLRSMEVRTC